MAFSCNKLAFQSCCCYSLRTGCIIIGIIYLLIDITSILFCSYGYISADNNDSMVMVMFMVMIIIDFISNTLLISGAVMQKRVYLLPWIIINAVLNTSLWIATAMGGVVSISIIITWNVRDKSDRHKLAGAMMLAPSVVAFTFGFLIIAVIHLLLLLVVFNHFRALREEVQRKQYHTIAYSNGVVNAPPHGLVPDSTAPIAPATAFHPDKVVFRNEKPV